MELIGFHFSNSQTEVNAINAIERLHSYLKDHGYHFIRFEENTMLIPRHQIVVYKTAECKEDERLWDAICQYGSYGYEEGKLEIMGTIVKPGGDSVEGWLTAEDIIERLEENDGTDKQTGGD